MAVNGDLEEPTRVIEHPFSKEGSPYLEHEVVIVAESQRQDAVETPDRRRPLAEL